MADIIMAVERNTAHEPDQASTDERPFRQLRGEGAVHEHLRLELEQLRVVAPVPYSSL